MKSAIQIAGLAAWIGFGGLPGYGQIHFYTAGIDVNCPSGLTE